jgi:hypothetical protein
LTILYEIGDIDRFPTIKDFLSYCRLGQSGGRAGNAAVSSSRHDHGAAFRLTFARERVVMNVTIFHPSASLQYRNQSAELLVTLAKRCAAFGIGMES